MPILYNIVPISYHKTPVIAMIFPMRVLGPRGSGIGPQETERDKMDTRNRRRTWTVGDCTISCESRIFTFVMTEAVREPVVRPARERTVKQVRAPRRRSKRAA